MNNHNKIIENKNLECFTAHYLTEWILLMYFDWPILTKIRIVLFIGGSLTAIMILFKHSTAGPEQPIYRTKSLNNSSVWL